MIVANRNAAAGDETLDDALKAFITVLDARTLADLLAERRKTIAGML